MAQSTEVDKSSSNIPDNLNDINRETINIALHSRKIATWGKLVPKYMSVLSGGEVISLNRTSIEHGEF